MTAPLPKNPLPRLADEIAAALPDLLAKFPAGPLAPAVAEYMEADVPNVRRAFEVLEEDGRAKIVRRKRALHLVSPDYPGRICIICRIEFQPVRKVTRTCSHSCARHLAWQNEDMRARHRFSVAAAKADPASRQHLSKINKARCAAPEWREKMSAQNRRSWKDPIIRAKRTIAMERAWQGEKARGRIDKASKRKTALWSDPAWREQTRLAMLNGKRGRFKRAVLALVSDDPKIEAAEIASRVGLTVEQVKIIWRRAARFGEVERRPKDERKCRQSHELIRNRVVKTRATKRRRHAEGAFACPQ